MKMKIGVLPTFGCEILNSHLNEEINQGILTNFVNASLRREVYPICGNEGVLTFTIATRGKKYQISAVMNVTGGPVVQNEHSSEDLYTSVENVISGLGELVRLKDERKEKYENMDWREMKDYSEGPPMNF